VFFVVFKVPEKIVFLIFKLIFVTGNWLKTKKIWFFRLRCQLCCACYETREARFSDIWNFFARCSADCLKTRKRNIWQLLGTSDETFHDLKIFFFPAKIRVLIWDENRNKISKFTILILEKKVHHECLWRKGENIDEKELQQERFSKLKKVIKWVSEETSK
jgi:hypothetical protein